MTEFSQLSDSELESAVYELHDRESDAADKLAQALAEKNRQLDSFGAAVTLQIRKLKFTRRRIQFEETELALREAISEMEYRRSVKDLLPRLESELAEAERETRAWSEDAKQAQIHISGLGKAVASMERREGRLLKLENSIESRAGNWLGVTAIGGSAFRPTDLAQSLKVALNLALSSSRTYRRIVPVGGLRSPDPSLGDFARVTASRGARLVQKFQQAIAEITHRRSA